MLLNYKYLAIMLAMVHMEGTMSIKSIGYKHNNPGNIRMWQGYPSLDGYAQFPNMLVGCEKMYKDIVANQGTSLKHFISKYAPLQDGNDTNEYMNFVSQWSGIKLDEIL